MSQKQHCEFCSSSLAHANAECIWDGPKLLSELGKEKFIAHLRIHQHYLADMKQYVKPNPTRKRR